MKINLIIMSVAASFTLPVMAQKAPVLYPLLSKTLDNLAFVDQRSMQEIMRGQTADSTKKRLIAEQYVNFARHQPVLEVIAKRYGFPSFKQVGEQSSKNFFLLVQHADAYPVFQQQVLKMMVAKVQRKNPDSQSFAYLTDRVALNSG